MTGLQALSCGEPLACCPIKALVPTSCPLHASPQAGPSPLCLELSPRIQKPRPDSQNSGRQCPRVFAQGLNCKYRGLRGNCPRDGGAQLRPRRPGSAPGDQGASGKSFPSKKKGEFLWLEVMLATLAATCNQGASLRTSQGAGSAEQEGKGREARGPSSFSQSRGASLHPQEDVVPPCSALKLRLAPCPLPPASLPPGPGPDPAPNPQDLARAAPSPRRTAAGEKAAATAPAGS